MVIIELLAQVMVSILVAYIGFTNMLAHTLTDVFPFLRTDITHHTEPQDTSPAPEDDALSQLPPTYTFGGALPKILIDNAEYQKAAVGSSSQTTSTTPSETLLPITQRIEAALVNIYCHYKAGGYIKTTAGTGFFIQENGVILTNAHVAQFLLLEEATEGVRDAECVIRTGNPAKSMYIAELLYISPLWVYANANLLSETHPQGTGERDYALLYLSKTIDGSSMPNRFPTLPLDTGLLTKSTKGTSVFTAGYPAEILFTEGKDAALVPKVAVTTVQELYTFGSNKADLFAVSGSSVSEQGSSGGPIVNEYGNVIGMITTKGIDDSDGIESLRAITLSYVDRTITEETGFSLQENMNGDLAYRGEVFKKVLTPFLSDLLTDEINSR